MLTPATIVFLGDLVDEASEATPEEQARSSVDHLAEIIIFISTEGPLSIVLPGDFLSSTHFKVFNIALLAMFIASTEFTHQQKGVR